MFENSIIHEKAVAQKQEVCTSKNNALSLSILLNALEEVSISQRDKDTRFERLVMDYFKYDRKFEGLYSKVQSYADWAADYPELAVEHCDIGIDLVATNTIDTDCCIDTTGGG